jgi:hypothetical protein|tara:strand:+ start:55 stop:195 length:141 start_codon:yes stop_codon:yes gene_type:complete
MMDESEFPVIRNEDHYNELKKEVTMAKKKKAKVKKKKKKAKAKKKR